MKASEPGMAVSGAGVSLAIKKLEVAGSKADVKAAPGEQ
eukprot:SAG31_NODE_10871_length_1088_cov_1.974722_2_plen_39_part_00